MKKLWLIGLGVGLLTTGLWGNISFAGNFKSGSEPDGFRGIKWGTDISTIQGMKDTGKGYSAHPDEKYYTREGDKLETGGAKLKKIQYSFYKGKFFEVTIWIEEKNLQQFRNIIKERFGKLHSTGVFWSELNSENVELTLYSGYAGAPPWFKMVWKGIFKTKEEKEEEQKAKEGAKDENW